MSQEDDPGYAVHQLDEAIELIALWAKKNPKALLREDGNLIVAESRLYALLQELGLTLARAA